MDLDSRHYSAAQLPNNDEGRIQPSTSSPSSTPCQETSGRSPSCPICGSAMLEKLKADPTVQSAAASVTDDGHALSSDSQVFSRVLTIAIGRMCMIAKEITVDERRVLTDDKDAMVGILENVCLLKTTIKYLLHEICQDGSNAADVHEMGRGGMVAEEDAATPSRYEDEEEDEEEDRGGSGSVLVFSKSGSFIERLDQGEDDDCDYYGNEHEGLVAEGKALSRRRGDQESESGSADQLTECKYSFFSREDDDDDDHNDRDGGRCSRSSEGDGQETEVAIRMISGGLIGGIATMSLIAKDTSEAKKVMLADDKQALAEMLDIVRMVKLLI